MGYSSDERPTPIGIPHLHTSTHQAQHSSSHYPSVYGTARAHPASARRKGPGNLDVSIAPLEPQPWVKDMWGWFTTNTVGIARVDLRRPIPPYPEQYTGNSLFFASYKQPGLHYYKDKPGYSYRRKWWPSLGWGGNNNNAAGGGSAAATKGPRHVAEAAAAAAAAAPGQPGGYYPSVPQHQPASNYYSQAGSQVDAPVQDLLHPTARTGPPTGARVKITRNFHLWRPEDEGSARQGLGQPGKVPVADLGMGVNIDMDRGRLDPVFRLKLGGMFSIKAFPIPLLKLSKTIPIANTGTGLKVLYEVPIDQVHHFYRPPARFMVRLDPTPGAGVRLTPAGVEMDQNVFRFGKNLRVRAAAGLLFPRSLPVDPDNDEFGLKIHRLSIKTLW